MALNGSCNKETDEQTHAPGVARVFVYSQFSRKMESAKRVYLLGAGGIDSPRGGERSIFCGRRPSAPADAGFLYPHQRLESSRNVQIGSEVAKKSTPGGKRTQIRFVKSKPGLPSKANSTAQGATHTIEPAKHNRYRAPEIGSGK